MLCMIIIAKANVVKVGKCGDVNAWAKCYRNWPTEPFDLVMLHNQVIVVSKVQKQEINITIKTEKYKCCR